MWLSKRNASVRERIEPADPRHGGVVPDGQRRTLEGWRRNQPNEYDEVRRTSWREGKDEMPVAQSQLRDSELALDAHRVVLAGSIDGLHYPEICPNCGAKAVAPLTITKVFQYNRGHTDDGGWQYRLAQATPVFCRDCLARHNSEEVPVTIMDKLRSVVFSELAIPGFGTGAFAFFLLYDKGPTFLLNLPRNWPVLAFIGGLLLISSLCLRTAWTNNAHRRVPVQTATSRAFDFGDDYTSPFQTTGRTYAIRNGEHAASLAKMNAERSAGLLGPSQHRRESWAFWITAAIIAALAWLVTISKLISIVTADAGRFHPASSAWRRAGPRSG